MQKERCFRAFGRKERGTSIALLALMIMALLVPAAARAEDAAPGVKFTVDARPDVTRVVPSGMVNYLVQITSKGKETITDVDLTFPYDWRRYKLRNVTTQPGTGDWVRKLTGEYIVINWGEFHTFETRTVTVTFQVGADVSIGSQIEPKISYSWKSTNHSGKGNVTPHWVQVVQFDNRPPESRVDPAHGPPGTVFQLYANHFLPGEAVETWLNTPNGIQPLDLRGTASAAGELWLSLFSDGYAPGAYSLVMRGTQSGQQATQTFGVQ